MKRDIFWIVTDEHRIDGIGAYGNPWIQTPNLDKLAAKGVLFNQAYCQSPACVASRASFLSGFYPNKTTNMWFDKTPSHVPFFPDYLQEIGYHTVNLGKEHHHRQKSPFKETVPSKGGNEGWPGELAEPYRNRKEELGILHRHTTLKQLIIGGTNPLPSEEAEVGLKVRDSINYLENYDKEDPLLYRLSVVYPHTPVIPPKPFDTMYDDLDLSFESDSTPSQGRTDFELSVYQEIAGVKGMSSEEIKKMRSSYYGLCSYVDHELGNFINYLEENWKRPYLIVFHSDHGNMLGEHELNEKFNMYRPSRQVPLMISGDGIPEGKKVDAFVELIDLAPTIMEYTGHELKGEYGFQGESLLALMKGETKSWRKYAFTEHRIFTPHDIFQHPALQNYVLTEIDGKQGYEVAKLAKIIEEEELDWYDLESTPYAWWGPEFQCLQNEKYSLTVRPIWKEGQGNDWMGTLYDLEKDPEECKNVFEDSKYELIRDELIEILQNKF